MPSPWRRWWPVVKALLCLAIVIFVGRRFAHDLARLELDRPVSVVPLLVCVLLYLAGLALAGLYWRWLLRVLGQELPLWPALRAYFISQLGKYVPGKALSLVMRAYMARQFGVPASIAGLTAFYEVFVTLAAGAALSCVLLLALGANPLQPPAFDELLAAWSALLTPDAPTDAMSLQTVFPVAILLALLLLLPTLPPVFGRLSRRFSPMQDGPRLGTRHLLLGLLWLSLAWLLMGGSLLAALASVPGTALPLDGVGLARAAGYLGVAYAAGFAILVAPGGLGVRELLLVVLLAPEIARIHQCDPDDARRRVALVALLLRLAWAGGELLLAAGFWLCPVRVSSHSPTSPGAV